jgi:hypothetical protein
MQFCEIAAIRSAPPDLLLPFTSIIHQLSLIINHLVKYYTKFNPKIKQNPKKSP